MIRYMYQTCEGQARLIIKKGFCENCLAEIQTGFPGSIRHQRTSVQERCTFADLLPKF